MRQSCFKNNKYMKFAMKILFCYSNITHKVAYSKNRIKYLISIMANMAVYIILRNFVMPMLYLKQLFNSHCLKLIDIIHTPMNYT
jgi:hypothetical protein